MADLAECDLHVVSMRISGLARHAWCTSAAARHPFLCPKCRNAREVGIWPNC